MAEMPGRREGEAGNFQFLSWVEMSVRLRILGFKPKRFGQWLAVVSVEGRRASYWRLVLELAMGLTRGV